MHSNKVATQLNNDLENTPPKHNTHWKHNNKIISAEQHIIIQKLQEYMKYSVPTAKDGRYKQGSDWEKEWHNQSGQERQQNFGTCLTQYRNKTQDKIQGHQNSHITNSTEWKIREGTEYRNSHFVWISKTWNIP